MRIVLIQCVVNAYMNIRDAYTTIHTTATDAYNV